ncbi:MAG: hypothetical protein ACREP9_18115, partial [Candidatus Dormibacteraceae bacterium]
PTDRSPLIRHGLPVIPRLSTHVAWPAAQLHLRPGNNRVMEAPQPSDNPSRPYFGRQQICG